MTEKLTCLLASLVKELPRANSKISNLFGMNASLPR